MKDFEIIALRIRLGAEAQKIYETVCNNFPRISAVADKQLYKLDDEIFHVFAVIDETDPDLLNQRSTLQKALNFFESKSAGLAGDFAQEVLKRGIKSRTKMQDVLVVFEILLTRWVLTSKNQRL